MDGRLTMEDAMFAVVFEVLPTENGYQRYLDFAAALRPRLDDIDGFLSVERFRSLNKPGWILSLSLWRDEAALVRWRGDGPHHAAQRAGREEIFADYRLRVVQILDEKERKKRACDRAQIGLHEHAPADGDRVAHRFESLTNAGKLLALREFANTDSALAWEAEAAKDAVSPQRVLRAATVRDYGRFDRHQAPQTFPDVKPR
jgi:heme-degrading monooxygenase HmoA